ncbi:MAG: PGPGW domain-containing protein [Thermodesulfobacteriota bacterium]
MDPTILKTIKQARRLIIIIVGFTILLMGIAMIVLPGPAILFIPLGLGILASELVWAKRILDKIKSKLVFLSL